MNLKLHHIGCIVDSIDAATEDHLRIHGGTVSEVYVVKSQKVAVCFASLPEGICIEFVQATETGSVIDGLKKKHHTYYHMGYKSKSFDADLNSFEQNGYRVLNIFNSEAFEMKRCAFLCGPDGRMTELIED